MATRENQGLQIALIIFLMITVGLAISTYYFFRQAEEKELSGFGHHQRADRRDQSQKPQRGASSNSSTWWAFPTSPNKW